MSRRKHQGQLRNENGPENPPKRFLQDHGASVETEGISVKSLRSYLQPPNQKLFHLDFIVKSSCKKRQKLSLLLNNLTRATNHPKGRFTSRQKPTNQTIAAMPRRSPAPTPLNLRWPFSSLQPAEVYAGASSGYEYQTTLECI